MRSFSQTVTVSGRTLWHTTTDPPNVGITETHGHLRGAHSWRQTATTTHCLCVHFLKLWLLSGRTLWHTATDPPNVRITETQHCDCDCYNDARVSGQTLWHTATARQLESELRDWVGVGTSRLRRATDRPKFCQSPIVDQVSLAFQKIFQNFFTSPILDQVSLACQ